MRTVPLATIDPDDDVGIADGETIFNGLLLAVIGRRRLLVLVGDSPAPRVGLLARLARHVESEGCLVLTVAAGPGVTVEDLIEVAGRNLLGPGSSPADFEELVEALEDRLDLAGAGVLMVEDADRLSTDTLRDLVDLSGSVSPSGRFLQILLSGGPELPDRLDHADLMPTVETVGTIYRIGPAVGLEAGPAVASRPSRAAEPPRAQRRPWAGILMTAATALMGGALVLYATGAVDPDELSAWIEGTPEPSEIALSERADPLADWRAQTSPPAVSPTQETPPVDASPTPADTPIAVEPVEPDPITPPPVEAMPPQAAAVDPLDAGTEITAPDPVELTEPEPPGNDVAQSVPLNEEPPAAESIPIEVEEAQLAAAEAAGAVDAVGDAPAEEAAIATPPAPPANAEEVARLVSLAEAQFNRRNLTTPQNDSAWGTLNQLASIDPDHPAIPDLRRRMIETYKVWAANAERRQDWSLARVYYQRALRVDPADREVTRRLDAVDDRLPGAPQPAASRQAQQDDAPPLPQLRP